MGFIDSYKRLEQICNSIYGDNHGVSTYIDEMIKTPFGYCYVPEWNEVLKRLKHYRWVRNKIVHELGYNEENMCTPYDVEWIDKFHSRIINTTDPLALYRKAIQQQTYSKQQQTYMSEPRNFNPLHDSTKKTSTDCFNKIIVGFIVWASIMIIAAIILIVTS